MTESDASIIIPSRVFIVPYRNRLEHKFFFSNQMSFILEGANDYEIHFSHQCDNRNFNRGATKNIGFLALKDKYPDDYKNITFIFNDVDTLPFHKLFDYETTPGVIKHYYGFEYALGGIVVIKGEDFERINGFPNFWGWGNEDKVLQTRSEKHGLIIDRSQFYKIGSSEILQLFDGVSRLVAPRDYHLGNNDSGVDGLSSINRLTFSIDRESLNPKDNKYIVANKRIWVINILSFLTAFGYEQNDYYEYDLRDPTSKIVRPDTNRTNKKVVTTEDWKNIAYKPTLEEQRQIAEVRVGQQLQRQRQQQQQQQQQQMQQRNIRQAPPSNVNIFSPEYARYIGAKPRATTSAHIRLGGVRR
jgi:hypothetical protein